MPTWLVRRHYPMSTPKSLTPLPFWASLTLLGMKALFAMAIFIAISPLLVILFSIKKAIEEKSLFAGIFTFLGLCLAPIAFPVVVYIYGMLALMQSHAPDKPEYEEVYRYQPKPKTIPEKWLDLGKTFLKYALFPLYVGALGIKKIIMEEVFPRKRYEQRFDHNQNERLQKYNIRTIAVQMPNNIQLHSCEYSFKAHDDNSNSDRPHILYFGGNIATYEVYIDKMLDDAEKLKAKVIGFHHSFSGLSGQLMPDGTMQHVSITSTSMLVQEGIAQVQRLIDEGIPAAKIVLYGHFFGGTTATLVAWHFNQQGIPIRLFSDRSFSSSSDYVMKQLMPDSNKSQHGIATAIAHLLRPILEVVLKLTDFDMSAGAKFQQIPKENRDYTVVRSVNKATHEVVNDDIVPYSASVHRIDLLRTERKCEEKKNPASKGRHKFFLMPTVSKTKWVKREYDKPHGESSAEEIQRSLNNTALSKLQNRYGVSAADYFNEFVTDVPRVSSEV